MGRPVLRPGRLLEPCGDAWSRGMTVFDRTRLIGRLRTSFPTGKATGLPGSCNAMTGVDRLSLSSSPAVRANRDARHKLTPRVSRRWMLRRSTADRLPAPASPT